MEKIKFDKVGFSLHQGICTNNGLKIIVAPVFGASEVKAGLYIDRGSLARDYFIGSTRIYPGTADLLVDSLLVKHPKKCDALFEKKAEVKGYVEESFTTISYKAKTEDAKGLLEPLLSLVDELNISNDEVEQYKNKYRKELEASELLPENLVRKNLYVNSPMGKNPKGDLENLKKVHLVALKRYFETFYQVNNMTLIVSGNISPNDVYEIANAHKFKRAKVTRKVRIQQFVEPEDTVDSQISYGTEKNTLVVGLKFPKREVLFNMFGDNLFSYYAILQEAIFSKANSRTKGILKSAVDIKQGGIKQGGEDAFLYQVVEVGDYNKGIAEIKELFSSPKAISRSDFKNLKNAYFAKCLDIYKNDVTAYFEKLCEDYANRFASQAITTSVKKMKYSKFINFLDHLFKSPISFVAEKE